MGVDDVDLAELFHGGEVEGEGVDGGFEFFFGVGCDLGRGLVAVDVEVAFVGGLGTPAVDFYFDFSGEFFGEVFDVDAGAAVDVGGVFASHQAYAHLLQSFRVPEKRTSGREMCHGAGLFPEMRSKSLRWKQ